MRPPDKTNAQQRVRTARPSKSPGSRAWRQAAKDERYFAVCLAVPEGLVSRYIGDNRGALPVFLIATTDWRDQNVIKATNLHQPYIRYRIKEKAVVDTQEHQERLKRALDEMLLGHQEVQDNVPPLNKAKDVLGCFDEKDDQSLRNWWLELLVEGQRELREGAREFRIFDDEEWDRRVEARRRRGR